MDEGGDVMNSKLNRYRALIESGDIIAYGPIPNNTFTFGELEYLYMKGYIYEHSNQFKAAITEF